MQPKTKLQKKVYSLYKELDQLSEEKKEWIKENSMGHYRYSIKTNKRNICMTCNHIWNGDDNKFCPSCNRKLKKLGGRVRHIKEKRIVVDILVYKKFQVLRYYWVERSLKSGSKPFWFIKEVFNHWINENGKDTVMAVRFNGMSKWTFNEGFCFWSDLSIKKDSNRFYCYDSIIIPGRKILPVIRRNGYSRNFYGYDPSFFFSLILTDTFAETLLKAGQYEVLKGIEPDIGSYWPAIKICIRNNYFIKDWSMYKDYISLLIFFNKDIRNRDYVCPKNLKKSHDLFLARKKRFLYRKKLRELKEKISRENESYIKNKKKFFGIFFTSGELNVSVLKNVEDFLIESNELNHCVFESEYYKRDDSLILSAKKGNTRLETIEISLRNLKILQCRGANNGNTRYHKEIINLVENNMNKIGKLVKSHD